VSQRALWIFGKEKSSGSKMPGDEVSQYATEPGDCILNSSF
jgi:hypothetical protein